MSEGESDVVRVAVKDGGVLSHEDVAHHPKGSTWHRHVECHERHGTIVLVGLAGSERTILGVQDVVRRREAEWMATDRERERGQ